MYRIPYIQQKVKELCNKIIILRRMRQKGYMTYAVIINAPCSIQAKALPLTATQAKALVCSTIYDTIPPNAVFPRGKASVRQETECGGAANAAPPRRLQVRTRARAPIAAV